MVPSLASGPAQEGPDRSRPWAFLVSTTPCARDIRDHLGSAAYSYAFVLEALAPVLERLGTWRLLDHPESSLPYAAACAAAGGSRPVHLALTPPQDCYLTPAVPTVLFPFWEFPDIPNRDFGTDTRQNWVRVCRSADLILTACRSTAETFRRAGVDRPVAVMPVPLAPEHFQLPAWDPEHTWTITCRHLVWGGLEEPEVAAPGKSEREAWPRSWRRGAWNLARAGFRRVAPWLSSGAVERITRLKLRALKIAGRGPGTNGSGGAGPAPSLGRRLYTAIRARYHRHVRRWLSADALERIARIQTTVLRWAGRPPVVVIDPLLPATPLTLAGLVYTSILNLGDRRKNEADLLTAFLIAFRDRSDATLVIKLATNPQREHHEVRLLRQLYQGLGLRHRCRVVVITDFLSDAEMSALMRVTTYYVNTSRAEGACLPLQQALAGGRPAVAPAHTAMADYLDDAVGFVLRTHPEPTFWPHDPERRIETYWNRLVWQDLRERLADSAAILADDPGRYRAMAEAARRRMAAAASRPVAAAALRRALERLPERPLGAYSWAS
jgi:glycosyltransferase involved in cell wall biosynthesis